MLTLRPIGTSIDIQIKVVCAIQNHITNSAKPLLKRLKYFGS